jgi:hypothetical protein
MKSISGSKKTWAEFVKEFGSEVEEALTSSRKHEGTTGLVCLVNHVMDSSKFGERHAMRYGPGCTYKSLEQIESMTGGVYTNGLPSSASFAEFYTEDMPS